MSVTFWQGKRQLTDYSTLRARLHDDETASVEVTVRNGTPYWLENFRFESGLPESACRVGLPEEVRPRSAGTITFTFVGRALFRLDIPRIVSSIRYDQVRRLG